MKRNVVITGIARGLGLCLSRVFLEQGDTVFGLVRKTSGLLSDLRTEYPDTLNIITCDVAETADVRAAAEKLRATIDHIDILINNAGVNLDMSKVVNYLETDFDEMAATFNINTAGPMRVVKAFAPLLRTGSLSVAISSGAGSITLIGSGKVEVEIAYRVSKAALNMAMQIYANTAGKNGVRVLLIDPGWMHTDMGTPAAPCDPDENARHIVSLLNRADTIPPDQIFVDYMGKPKPW
jgi:NAD(P)-dependent dehydrogenase (short-subunit alcohol dehydrogenase family)